MKLSSAKALVSLAISLLIMFIDANHWINVHIGHGTMHRLVTCDMCDDTHNRFFTFNASSAILLNVQPVFITVTFNHLKNRTLEFGNSVI